MQRKRAHPVMEAMEPRLLLAGPLSITEFMADNTKTLKDKDGAYSDWIEINNNGPTAVNLNGYYLTDSASNLTEWRFPSVSVAAGGYLVVFASDKNITTGPELHTNFKLGAGGDYLALVQPDGHTLVTEFTPQYPAQYEDVSYGYGQDILTKTLVGAGAAAKVLVPSGGALGLTWTNWSFADASWTAGTTGVGYESVVPGFAVRDYMGNFYVSTLAEAESVISQPLKRRDQTVYTENSPFINYWNNGGDAYFGSGRNLPGVTPPYTYWENIVSEATGWIVIPAAGQYTFGVNSDDGFGLTITGATTTWTSNTSTPAGSSVMDYQGSRGPGDTWATFNFPTAGRYPVRFVWFQGNGGAEVEWFATPGSYRAFNYTDYKLVGDTANGGLAAESLPLASGGGAGIYAPVIQTNVEAAMKGVNASAYVRLPFTIADLSLYNSLTLKMKYDDGFVAYLNGVEVARRNAPASVTWNSSATAEHLKSDALKYEEIDISSRLGLLRVGQNVLAIQGLNYGANNTDFLVLPELVDIDYLGLGLHYFSTATPGKPNLTAYFAYAADTKFDHDRGFYDAPFDLAITTATPGAQIRYTLDGSAPTATTGTAYAGPIHLTTTSVVRAAAYKTGYEPSNVDTQTYLFLSDVIHQPAGPAGFPTTWGANAADYEMDPTVVNDPAYSAQIIDALKSIPTMSIVGNVNDLFGPSGLMANPYADTTVPISLEYFQAGGGKELQVNAGGKIYGNVGRDPSFYKHSIRIKFMDLYGPTKLKFDLFGGNATQEFDTLILRANFNDDWIWGGANVQYIRDQWNREAQLLMGGLSSHGTFVHLYINGLYWGLYNPVERPDDAFAAAYLGGDKTEYDARSSNETGPIAGDEVAWNAMFNLANTGNINGGTYDANALASSANYQAIQQYLDVPGLADYVLMNFYGGNWDWDGHNWYAARRRVPGAPYEFFSWDAEGTLGANGAGLGTDANITGLNNDRNPTRLFTQLRANTEFKLLLMDHIYKLLFNDGLLTPGPAAALYDQLATEVRQAIIGESARWGDLKREPPYTLNANWQSTLNWEMNTYFPQRTAIVLAQLRNAGMYPLLTDNAEAPDFSQHGGNIQPGFALTMSNPNSGGTIYYTIDGSDPRLPGGAISPSALIYGGAITLTDSRLVRARVKNGALWSAMHEAVFLIPTPPALRITELMFHPAHPPTGSSYSAEDFEYIELKNIGATPLNLNGMRFSNGIDFTFPNMTLAPGAYTLVVANQAAFQSRYPTVPAGLIAGQYVSGNLNNAGERIELDGKFGEPILDFSYSPAWYPAADGEGFSLSLLDPLADRSTWGDKESWWLSQNAGGTPGADNTGMAPHSIVINELLAHTDAAPMDWVELKNTTSQPINVGGWYLSDDLANLKKYRLAAGTTIQAGQYLVLNERDSFGNPADPGSLAAFGYSEYGESVYLTAADSGDNLLGYREVQDFGASDREVPFIRFTKSTGKTDFVAASGSTPGAENAYPKIGPVIINEVMYHPANGTDEFIELRNVTASPVLLYDPVNPDDTWKIDGGVGYTFATGLSIPAGGYLLLVNTDPAAFRAKYGVPADVQVLGPFTGQLSNAGDNVRLYKPGDPDPLPPHQVPYYVVDRLSYNDVAPWPVQADGLGPSIQRSVAANYGNDPTNWYAGPNDGTPGRANGTTDVTPPWLDSVKTTDGIPNQITVTFNEALDPVSSRDPLNYVLDSGVAVTGVTDGANNRSVVLTTSNLTEGALYTLSINHVRNAVGIEIAADTQTTFNYTDSGKGLKGQYFQYTSTSDMFNPANLRATRIDPLINFNWDGAQEAAPGVVSSNFAVRWTGSVKAVYSETYTFYTLTDDGVSLWVNGQQLVNDPGWHGDTWFSGSIALVAGQNYDIKMEFYQGGGPATAKLYWSSPSTAQDIIPTRNLYDTSRPTVASAKAQNATTLAVVFTEEMERDSAQNLANYQVTYPVNQPVTVTQAVLLPDHKTVWLTLASPMTTGTTYSVTAADVVAKSGYPVRAGSYASFTYTGVPAAGNVLREWWLGIGGGTAVSDLTNNVNYPNNPSGFDYPVSFEAPVNWADSYGERMRAYVTAPTAGNYVFWISSDDNSELWLGTNDSPTTRRKIAWVSSWTGSRQWTVEANQRSASAYPLPITLQAGQRYYIEALMKEGGGGDNLCVRWQLPSGAIEEPIPASRLTAFVVTPANTVTVAVTDPNASENGPDKGTFTITRTGSTAQALTVCYTVTGTARTPDMQQYLTGTATIPVGAAQVAVDVLPVDDAIPESPETVILTLVPDQTYGVGASASGTVTIADNDLAKVAAIAFGNPHGRNVSEIVSSVLGVHVITVTFSQPMTFGADDVVVQKVRFNGNSETVTATLLPTSVDGTGSTAMTINLAAGPAVDTWVKVTLKGNGTLKNLQGNALDGEPKAGGSGRTYVYSAATDLPTGNGTPGGNTVFYVGSLRGDFASVGGVHTPDGRITPEDVDGFLAEFLAADPDADFRGAGFTAAAPDGLVTPTDIDGFLSVYEAIVAANVRLAALPNPGPQGEGEPGPLAAAEPEAVGPAPVQVPLAPLLEVDALAMASEMGARGPSVFISPPVNHRGLIEVTGGMLADAAGAPAAPAAGLTVELDLATGVPLAFSAAEPIVPPKPEPVLAADSGIVDLLALGSLGVPLEV